MNVLTVLWRPVKSIKPSSNIQLNVVFYVITMFSKAINFHFFSLFKSC